MNHNQIYKKLFRKLIYTIFIVVLLTTLNNTTYPGIVNKIHALHNKEKFIFDACCITSQGIRPNIFANIIINLITSISSYFNNMQKKGETRAIYEKIYIALIVIISITYSTMQYQAIIPFIISEFKSVFFAVYTLINTSIALFFTWLNRHMLISGLGNGITIILTIQILNRFINMANIHSIIDYFKFVYCNFFYIIIMFLLCAIFEDTFVELNVRALNPSSKYIIDEAKNGSIKYKPLNSNVTAHVLTAQVKNISVFIGQFLHNSQRVYVYNTFMRYVTYIINFLYTMNSHVSQFMYFIALFVFNYMYNNVYYHRLDRIMENMKNNICYILYIRIGDIPKFMHIASIKCALIAVIMTMTLVITPKIIFMLSNNTYTINKYMIPLDLMIMSSTFMHFKEFFFRLSVYYEFKLTSSNFVFKSNKN